MLNSIKFIWLYRAGIIPNALRWIENQAIKAGFRPSWESRLL